jgi:hypothetical protein
MYCLPTIAQEYDHKLHLVITIEDEIIYTRPPQIIQTHTLSINKDEDNELVYTREDLVGFEFSIDNRSESGKTYYYKIGYTPRQEGGVISLGDEDEVPSGIITPVVLPPVEDEDDEDTNTFASPYPYTLQNKSLYLEGLLGYQTLQVTLFHKSEENNIYNTVDLVSNTFRVILSNEIPVNAAKTEGRIKLYPNPLDTHLYIEPKKSNKNQNTTNNIATVEVYTMQGILLKKSLIKSTYTERTLLYDFINPSLKRGTYIYKITIDGETYVKMLQKK